MRKPSGVSLGRWLARLVLVAILGGVQCAQVMPVQAAAAPTGGVTLDGWGGLHAFGGISLNAVGAPYWSGWDIARAISVRADGSGGWMLDGWGGIHAFGVAAPISVPAYWPHWDIARALVVTSRDASGHLDGRQGYVLDGWGGIHAWGGAPALSGQPYTPNRDMARGLEIHYSVAGIPDGGWLLDARGRIAAFGAAPALPVSGWPNAPVFRQLHGGAQSGYAVGRYGVVSTYGSGISPYWSGYNDWGSWDIVRDIVLINPSNPTPTAQPVSPAATSAYQAGSTLAVG